MIAADAVDGWDFFVSYTADDRAWAEWIAWQLEDAGFTVLIQAWDFVPGSHWVSRMAEGVRRAERTVAVLSEAYLRSGFGRVEWEAVFRRDPAGAARALVPVRVEDCPLPPLMDGVVSFDLFGLSAAGARTRLLAEIRAVVAGRAKPVAEPLFPGAARAGDEPLFPGGERLPAGGGGEALPGAVRRGEAPTGVVGSGAGWLMPRPEAGLAARPELAGRLVDRLLSADSAAVGVSTTLHGVGGFGKTTLAQQVCADPRVRRRFRRGLWVTLGQEAVGAALAEKVCALAYQLAGVRLDLSDPEQAGLRLGALLDRHDDVLLVVDDVWSADQLRPLLHGGRANCGRIITTRRPSVLPHGLEDEAIVVDQLTDAQARALLTADLPPVPEADLAALVALTGRWPLLVRLAHRWLVARVRRGASAHDAAERLIARLREDGPGTLDIADESSRAHAVGASIRAGTDLLTPVQRERFFQLCAFPEDTAAPTDVLQALWRLSAAQVERFGELLADLGLVVGSDGPRLQDVVRAYLRAEGRDRLRDVHEAVVAIARDTLPEGGAWWRLPPDADYLWRHLCRHLADAGRTDEVEALVTDLRWVLAKLARGALSSLDIDLGAARGPAARRLRRALVQNAHVLGPLEPPRALADTLLSRLHGVPELEPAVEAHVATPGGRPWLSPRRPLPDQPHPALRHALTGPGGWVLTTAAAPDGRLLATAGWDAAVRLWDVRTGELRHVLTGPTDWVLTCAFTPDSALLVAGGRDSAAHVWGVATGAPVAVLSGHANWVTACAAAPDGSWIATASDDGTARTWSTDGTPRHTLTGHRRGLTACVIAPDGTWLATASWDGTVRLWDPTTGACTAVLTGHAGRVCGLAAHPDGVTLASTGDDGTVRVWVRGEPVHRFDAAAGSVPACAFTPDGTRLVAVTDDGSAIAWDVAAGSPPHRFPAHAGPATGCAVAPDGTWFATVGDDGAARTWHTADASPRATLTGHTGPVLACATAPDGTWLATAGRDGTARTWDTAAGGDPTANGREQPVTACAVAPGGTWFATTGRDRAAHVRDVATGATRLALTGHEDVVTACAIAPDGTWLVTTGRDETARIWDVATGATRHVLGDHVDYVVDCAIAPDGTWLVTAGRDGVAVLWDVASGAPAHRLTGHRGSVTGCVVAPDGTWLATAGDDGTARLWDPATGAAEGVLRGDSGVAALAVAPDGSRLVTAGRNGVITLWDPGSGTPVGVFPDHRGGATACAVTAEWFVTAGEDGVARVRDLRTGAEVHALAGHAGGIAAVAVAPGGRLLATAGRDRVARVWDVADGRSPTGVRVGGELGVCAWLPDSSGLVLGGHAGVYLFDFQEGSA
ncbi:TIR domain-containing protein [Saccharothrix obliqua]|uniref:TIR domain-containing protein n=1 Tax=Saccharothrix obliqua TaxID=2861747 RepID=UPI001C5F9B42|nr:TIR domain-containing protein [Saccharothrix obliqua]MBW4720528.1 TIR domain-containing protein [Saccharothrix obliqua]